MLSSEKRLSGGEREVSESQWDTARGGPGEGPVSGWRSWLCPVGWRPSGAGGRSDPLLSVLRARCRGTVPWITGVWEGSTREKCSGHGRSEIPVGQPEGPSGSVGRRHPSTPSFGPQPQAMLFGDPMLQGLPA